MPADVSYQHDTPQGPRTVSVRYERRGSGSPLLLLHGIGHHWQAWAPVLDELAEEHEVVAVDLPGFGASAPLPDGVAYDIGSVVPGLGGLCAALGLERPHVAGNSLGGLLALEMGRRGLARSVTALSPAGFWNRPEQAYAFGVLLSMRLGAKTLPAPAVRRLAAKPLTRGLLVGSIYAHPSRRGPVEAAAETKALRDATGFARTLRAGLNVNVTEDVTDVPVTIGWGTKDRLLVPRQAERARQRMPKARVVPLPGCGHVPMNDDPQLVARTVLDGSRDA
ncbi:alpha/beta fold hydrolase [Streptacidiphilus jiangxiensis]|uniref:Pimeloyl-ACP methyl ester carboxylesterase n=1 Tax=Streptacidiphilus jiangxiensis TaxID=235985 RepID=A0A1H8A906_STRJI|nr:alpha/beta hydrolase [Streptacidiphilus jiangxiensis]SEM67170.1 Pimeloyl-ACP methyl ester carboxylesterase [Streptacidiphilus jiangxiensis]